MEKTYSGTKKPNLNKFATKGSEFESGLFLTKNPLLHIKLAAPTSPPIVSSWTWKVSCFEPADRNLVSNGTPVCTTKRSGKRAEQRRYTCNRLGTKYPMPITMRLNLTECFIRLSGILTSSFEDLKAG